MSEKKTETIQTKVTKPFRNKLYERATKEGVSLSSSINSHLIKSFEKKKEIIDVVDSRLSPTITESVEIVKEERVINNSRIPEDLPLAIFWLYYKTRTIYTGETSLEELKYFFEILDRHIRNLDFELMTLFIDVHKDLKMEIEKNENRYYKYINLEFAISYSSRRFDFETFEKLILDYKL